MPLVMNGPGIGTNPDEMLVGAAVLAERAEKVCMISKAIRGNVEVRVEANVLVRV